MQRIYQRPLFELSLTDPKTKARLGKLRLPAGDVETPVFMPVGTIGTVKTLSAFDMKELGYNLILHNTFHLFLRPGMELIQDLAAFTVLTAGMETFSPIREDFSDFFSVISHQNYRTRCRV